MPAQTNQGAIWLVAPSWRQRSADLLSGDWFRLAADLGAELVKRNPVRRVWRVRRAGAVFFVKEVVTQGLLKRLRCLCCGPPLLQEWRVGTGAQSAGVPVVAMVACGIRRGWLGRTHSVLITEAAEGAAALPHAWRCLGRSAREAAPPRRRAVARAVARLLARAHQAGFVHRDGHPGNILVRVSADCAGEALYVDLYGASFRTEVAAERAAANLAPLNLWSRRNTSRSMRLRFLSCYLTHRCGGAPPSREVLRGWARRISDTSRSHAAALYARRDRRLKRSGTHFAIIRPDFGGRALVALRFRNREEFPEPAHPDRSPDAWRTWLNEWREVYAGRSAEQAGAARVCVRAGGFAVGVARMDKAWTAKRAFAVGHGLRHRDLPCVWPLAALYGSDGPPAGGDLLLTEMRTDSLPLADVLDSGHPAVEAVPGIVSRRAVFACLGRLLADMADRGVIWADPRPQSFLLTWPGGPDAAPRALVRDFRGISFDRRARPQSTRALRRLAGAFRSSPGVTPLDLQALVAAWYHRQGRPFPVEDWPECPTMAPGKEQPS